MYRINFGLAMLLVILILLPSSMSIPFQPDSQPLIQQAKAQNIRDIETDITQDPQADLEYYAKFLFDQKNRCKDSVDCLNEGTIALNLAALGRSSVESDSIQKIAQQNKCRGDDTLCSNFKDPEFLKSLEISITALGQSDIEADAYQLITGDNKCNGSANCKNGIGAMFTAFGSDGSLDGDVKQKVHAENRCNDGAICTNFGSAGFNLVATDHTRRYQHIML